VQEDNQSLIFEENNAAFRFYLFRPLRQELVPNIHSYPVKRQYLLRPPVPSTRLNTNTSRLLLANVYLSLKSSKYESNFSGEGRCCSLSPYLGIERRTP